MDIVTLALAKKSAKNYTDNKLDAITTNMDYKGPVSSVEDLPATATAGDIYSVGGERYLYNGTEWEKIADSDYTELSGEVEDLKSATAKVETALRIVEPENKLNPNTVLREKQLYSDGNAYDNANYFVSDWIPVAGGETFCYTRKNSSGVYLDANVMHLCQYTSAKSLIQTDTYAHTKVLDDACAFIRIDNPLAQLDADGAVSSVTFDYTPAYVSEIIPWHEPYIYLTADRFDQHVSEFDDYKEEASTEVRPANELNLNNILADTIITANGDAENNTCFTTNYFIPVFYGDLISFSGINSNGVFVHTAVNFVNIGMYDANKNLIAVSGMFKNDFVINQANCKYIRVSVANSALSYQLAALTINTKPTIASLTEYHAPYYSSTYPSPEKIRSRRVLWLGTSIPTYGYPQILANLCGARVFNEAIGSSGIAKGIEPNITTANVCGIRSIWGLYGLTQTIAEKQTMIDNWTTIASEIGSTDTLTDDIKSIALASSYETIVDPYLTGDNAVDLIVLNHAYNDSTEYAVAPENDKLNTHYLEGAYNWLINRILEANPNMGIVIFGHYSDLPTSKETALQNVADRWNIPYYLLKNDLGWSSAQSISTTKRVNAKGQWETITATDMIVKDMWLGDNIHPIGVGSKRIAQVSQNVFADWLKMYCDPVN